MSQKTISSNIFSVYSSRSNAADEINELLPNPDGYFSLLTAKYLKLCNLDLEPEDKILFIWLKIRIHTSGSYSLNVSTINNNSQEVLYSLGKPVIKTSGGSRYAYFDITKVYLNNILYRPILKMPSSRNSKINPSNSSIIINYLSPYEMIEEEVNKEYELDNIKVNFNVINSEIRINKPLFENILSFPLELTYSSYLKRYNNQNNYLPHGWRLNILEYLEFDNSGDIILYDSSNKRRVFSCPIEYIGNDLKYDTSGSGMIIKYELVGNDYVYRLYKNLHNTSDYTEFNTSGKVISIKSDNRIISITYNTDNIQISDDNGHIITFSNHQIAFNDLNIIYSFTVDNLDRLLEINEIIENVSVSTNLFSYERDLQIGEVYSSLSLVDQYKVSSINKIVSHSRDGLSFSYDDNVRISSLSRCVKTSNNYILKDSITITYKEFQSIVTTSDQNTSFSEAYYFNYFNKYYSYHLVRDSNVSNRYYDNSSYSVMPLSDNTPPIFSSGTPVSLSGSNNSISFGSLYIYDEVNGTIVDGVIEIALRIDTSNRYIAYRDDGQNKESGENYLIASFKETETSLSYLAEIYHPFYFDNDKEVVFFRINVPPGALYVELSIKGSLNFYNETLTVYPPILRLINKRIMGSSDLYYENDSTSYSQYVDNKYFKRVINLALDSKDVYTSDIYSNYLNYLKGIPLFYSNNLKNLSSYSSVSQSYTLKEIVFSTSSTNNISLPLSTLFSVISSSFDENRNNLLSLTYLKNNSDNTYYYSSVNVIKYVDPTSSPNSYEVKSESFFDASSHKIKEIDKDNIINTYSYDSKYNLIEKKSFNSSNNNLFFKDNYYYDSSSRMTSKSDYINQEVSTSYNYLSSTNLISKITSPLSNKKEYEYLSYRFIKKVKEGNTFSNIILSSSYSNDLLSSDSTSLNKFTYSYDSYNDLSNITYSLLDNTNQTSLISVSSLYSNNNIVKEISYPNFATNELIRVKVNKFNHLYEVAYVSSNNVETKIIYHYKDVGEYSSNNETFDSSVFKIEDGLSLRNTFFTYNDDKSISKIEVKVSNTLIYEINYDYDLLNRIKNSEFKISSSNYIKQNFSYLNSDEASYKIKNYVNSSSIISMESTLSFDTYKRTSSTENLSGVNYLRTYLSYYDSTSRLSNYIKRVDYYHNSIYPNEIYDDSDEIEYNNDGLITYITNININTNVTNYLYKYSYDAYHRLVREDNKRMNLSYKYTYDDNGNITLVQTGYYSLSSFTLISSETFTYHSLYKDRLISYNGTSISYDSYLNPISFGNKSYTYVRGRLLSSYSDSSNSISVTYSYDKDNIRYSKVVSDNNSQVTYNYFYQGNRLMIELRGSTYIYYLYGSNGLVGFVYNGSTYKYRRNPLGDITHIYDSNNNVVALYRYDAYGNNSHNSYNSDGTLNTSSTFIGNINPFRYRGYYFDNESRMYYCINRYYVPQLRRWLNGDKLSYLDNSNIQGLNLYTYCLNNPIMYRDEKKQSKTMRFLKRQTEGLKKLVTLEIAPPNTVFYDVNKDYDYYKWFAFEQPKFFNFSNNSAELISLSFSIFTCGHNYGYPLNEKMFASLGNIIVFAGYGNNDKHSTIGLFLGASVGQVGVGNDIIEVTFDCFTAKFLFGIIDGKFKLDPGFGFFDFGISIDFKRLFEWIFGK